MMLMDESTADLVDQERAVVPGGTAYLTAIARRRAPPAGDGLVRGLLSPAERQNSGQLADVSGDATPYAFQHLLRRALWDPEAVRHALRTYIVQQLADPNAVLVLDETGFLKNWRDSVGVARQYSGTAGKVDNGQMGVFLGYTSPLDHALRDRELYLPKEWTNDRDRCRRAGIPEDRGFATTPQLA